MSKLDEMLRTIEIERKYFPEYFKARNDELKKHIPETRVTGITQDVPRGSTLKKAKV